MPMATATATQQASYAINAYNVDVAISILRSVLPGTTLVAFLMGILFCQYWIILTRQTTSKTLHAVLAVLMVLNVTHSVTAILYMRHFAVDLLISAQQSLAWKGFTWHATVLIFHYNAIQGISVIFFARRCYLATSRSLRIGILIFTLAFGCCLMGLLVTVLNIVAFFSGRSFITTKRWLSATLVLYGTFDLINSITLIAKLTRSELIHYKNVVLRICLGSVTTSSVTTVFAITQSVLLLANDKGQKVYMALGYLVPHIMSTCVLAAVITRASLNQRIGSSMPAFFDGLVTGDTESARESSRKASDASVGLNKETPDTVRLRRFPQYERQMLSVVV